ncbi:MAG TPA: DUF302 domain-containing protein [Burkholderiales bacterium]|nr:DUF302 domain-containing protein [Burkholderiales bacterium]
MRSLHNLVASILGLFVIAGLSSPEAYAADNPAFWKHQVKRDFSRVLSDLKSGLEAKQFMITGEEDLAKGLENNKSIFGENKWNTIGFKNATAVHFCSLVFNQEVFNLNMDWSVLCPFKLVAYSMKDKPDSVTIVMVRPSYIMAKDPHAKAKEIGKRIEERIVSAIKESLAQ